MKKAILASAVLMLSQVAMAESVKDAVKSFEQANAVTCHYSRSSDYSYCLNYTCRYKQYYVCTNQAASLTLVLKVNSFRVPGESPVNTVVESTVE